VTEPHYTQGPKLVLRSVLNFNYSLISNVVLLSYQTFNHFLFLYVHYMSSGPGSSVGIATDYGLDDPGIKSESRWGQDFLPIQTSPGAHPASRTMGTGSFPGVKCGWGVLVTTHSLLEPRSWKSRAIPLRPSGPQPGL